MNLLGDNGCAGMSFPEEFFDSPDEVFGEKLEPVVPGPLTEVGKTTEGYSIYRRTNGVGGHSYYTDEFGLCTWDTSCTSPELMKQLLDIESKYEQE